MTLQLFRKSQALISSTKDIRGERESILDGGK